MSSSPPPPYSLCPPPYMRRSHARNQKKSPSPHSHSHSPPPPRRPSSRELLTEALQRAQRAVELDSAESDLRAAITAYDDAIALLQRVIERRSKKPECSSEVDRVTDIHDRYVERVRELCSIRRIPLPSHVFPVPATGSLPISFSIATGVSPTKSTTSTITMPYLDIPDIIQHPRPDSPPPLSRAAIIQRLKLKHRHRHRHRTHRTHPRTSDSDNDGDDDDDHYGDDETERETGLSLSSPCSSKSTTPETQSPIWPVDDNDNDEDGRDDHSWILSAARDDELEEWGQYLDEAGENHRLSDPTTAASSARWTAIALSCGEYVHNSLATHV